MGIMRIMSPQDGDKHVRWNPKDEKSTEKARKKFEKLLEKGYKAYKVKTAPQRKGTPVVNFEEINATQLSSSVEMRRPTGLRNHPIPVSLNPRFDIAGGIKRMFITDLNPVLRTPVTTLAVGTI